MRDKTKQMFEGEKGAKVKKKKSNVLIKYEWMNERGKRERERERLEGKGGSFFIFVFVFVLLKTNKGKN